MAILSKGTDFTTGDQVTAAKLDALVDSATFAAGAVDDSTTALDSSTPKKIIVKNGGISSTQLATDSVTTVKVENNAITLAKMATQADQTVLGNVSGGAAVPTAIPIVDNAGILINSDSLGTSDTKGATQGNIKAYVDASSTDGFTPATVSSGQKSVTLPNGLIMKFGTATSNTDNAQTFDFTDLGHTDFPNECINLTTGGMPNHVVGTLSPTSFVIDRFSSIDGTFVFHWQAIGR